MAALPMFLIVGAMKSGTTTLYHDLQKHPDIFMPAMKEPETLVRFATAAQMRADYAELFGACEPTQILGEASTAYTKRPDYEGVAARALDVCGSALRVIYMRRDPIGRIISHYQHEKQFGAAGTIDEAVRLDPRYINYSRYDWQIAPWIETFGRDQVLELSLEQLSTERAPTVRRVLNFLGVDSERMSPIEEAKFSNSSREQKFIANPALRTFVYSSTYQKVIKPRIPLVLRERARRTMLPVPKIDSTISADTARYIKDQLAMAAPA
jgi:hypothetical protein